MMSEMKLINAFFILFILSACGNDMNLNFDAGQACQGGSNLLISQMTPTYVKLASSGTTTIPAAYIRVENVNCESLAYTMTSNTGSVLTTISTGQMETYAKNVNLTVTNILIDQNMVTGTTGTINVWANTPTRTSQTVPLVWSR